MWYIMLFIVGFIKTDFYTNGAMVKKYIDLTKYPDAGKYEIDISDLDIEPELIKVSLKDGTIKNVVVQESSDRALEIELDALRQKLNYYKALFNKVPNKLDRSTLRFADSLTMRYMKLRSRINSIKKRLTGKKLVIYYQKSNSKAVLKISFFTTKAYWKEYYTIQAYPSENKILFDISGKVLQEVDSIWKNVRITLHTRRRVMPVVKTLPPQEFLEEEVGAGEEGALSSSPLPIRRKRSGYRPESSVKFLTAGPVYQLDYTYTLPYNALVLISPVKRFNLKSSFIWEGDLHSISLKAKAKKPDDLIIFPNVPAYLYLDDEFLSSDYSAYTLKGDSIEFSFGPDPLINVRKKLIVFEHSKNLFEKMHRYKIKHHVEVFNNRKNTIEIHLWLQIPLRGKQRIENFHCDLPILKKEPLKGRYQVKFKVKGNSRKTFNYSFELLSPWEENKRKFLE